MIIFNFDFDYKKYDSQLYGISVNNGGHYLDSRFNLADGFSTPNNANLKTIW